MAKIGFSYFPRPVIDLSTNLQIGEVFTPYIPIRLSTGHGNQSRIIDALLDSGADRNLFPISQN
ncbi:MAG: hypothetical protein Q7S44_03525 [bacterium]|nr:hypothetical protein [bacterium]